MTHADPEREMDDERLRARLAGFNFYHTIELTQTLSTPGWPVVVPIVEMVRRVMRRVPLAGRRMLDIGCRDGILSFDAEAMGALEVLGIDSDLNRPAVDFLVDWKKSRVRFLSYNLFDLTADAFGGFDAAIFAGVLYHLRYPF